MILGGDGFCGWPTALHLSNQGYEVAIVDNLSRRKIDIELEVSSLTPIRPMGERLRAWKEASGKDISFHDIDVAINYQRLLDLIEDWKPDALVHFAGFNASLDLANQHPDKQISFLERNVCYCSTMNRIDLPHLVWALEELVAGRVVNEIKDDESTAHYARAALDQMLALP